MTDVLSNLKGANYPGVAGCHQDVSAEIDEEPSPAGSEGSAAHTLGGGNPRSPRAGCKAGTEEGRVTPQGFSGPGFYFRGGSRRGGVFARTGGAPPWARLAGRRMSLHGPVPGTRRRAARHRGAPCSWVQPARRYLLPSLQPCCCCWRRSPDLRPVLQRRQGRWGVPRTAGVISGQGRHPLPARHRGKG